MNWGEWLEYRKEKQRSERVSDETLIGVISDQEKHIKSLQEQNEILMTAIDTVLSTGITSFATSTLKVAKAKLEGGK